MMKRFKICFCIALCCIIGECFAQHEIKKCDYGHLIGGKIEYISLGDTSSFSRQKFIPLNCDGDIKVNEYYRNGNIFAVMFFKGVPSYREITIADPDTYEISIKKEYYYESEPDKIWVFYNINGDILGELNFGN